MACHCSSKEAEEMEEYTRVPMARETDRQDCGVWRSAKHHLIVHPPPPPSQQVTESGREEEEKKSMTTEDEEQASKMALTAHHWLKKGFCVHTPSSDDHKCFIRLTPHPYFYFIFFDRVKSDTFLSKICAILAVALKKRNDTFWMLQHDRKRCRQTGSCVHL